jgi:soluble lytic murein transglycosylase
VTGSGWRLLKVALLWLAAGAATTAAALAADPPAGAPSITADTNAVRQEYIAAMLRVRQHAQEPPDSAALIAYPIYDYLLAARYRRDLGTNAGDELDTAIDTFVQDRPHLPVTRALRHDWLVSLAARARWDWFLPRADDASDPTLICDRLAGRLATGSTTGLGADVLALWSTPARAPHECDGVFGWLKTQNLITPAAAETRTRAALSADNLRLARDFAADVPTDRLTPLTQWIHLLESPKSALEQLASEPTTPVEADAMLAGLTRLARGDSAAALALLPRLLARPDTSALAAGRLQRAVALGAAYDHNTAAVAAFRAVPIQANDGDGQEWRIRAALWSGDFQSALHWIEESPESLRSQPRWRYWQARATEATLGSEAAAPIYSALASLRDYYGYLAADRVQQHYDLNMHASADDVAAQTTLASAPGLIRAHELFECDQVDDAALEWATVLADAQPATKVQAAHLAARWGWYNQDIVTLAQAGVWDDLPLRYPHPFASEVARASLLTQLPGEWIWSVMRQESLFRRDATSRADARGLMQLLPPTATAVAHRWHLSPPGRDGLFDASVAVPLGAAYLKELSDHYHGELALTLAAYNAGPQAVARWMPSKAIDADIWTENIPFNETRNYVQRVLEHIVAYGWDHPQQIAPLTPLLAPVQPSAALIE